MVLTAVTIEDGATGGFGVYEIPLEGKRFDSKITPSELDNFLANTYRVSGKNNIGGTPADPILTTDTDLEGLGRVGARRAYAITESNFGDDPSAIIRNTNRPAVDRLFETKGQSRNFGSDSGLALQLDRGDIVAYNLQGNDEPGDGPIGSRLYEITNGNPPTRVSELKYNGKNEFGDSLAIQRNNSKFAIATDLEPADGDGFELYTINLNNGNITDVAKIRLLGGQNFKSSDSGLDIAPGGKETYLITDATNDIYELDDNNGQIISRASRLGQLPNTVDFDQLVDLPNEGAIASIGEFEGLAVLDL